MLMNTIYSKLFWRQEEDFAMRNDSARCLVHQLQRARAVKARERQRLRNTTRGATLPAAKPEQPLVPSKQHAQTQTEQNEQDDTRGRWLIRVQSPPAPRAACSCSAADSQGAPLQVQHESPAPVLSPGVEAARWADRREQIRRQRRGVGQEEAAQHRIFRLALRLKRLAFALLPELRA